jgi:outer membrane receptor protein involved in Fe transport
MKKYAIMRAASVIALAHAYTGTAFAEDGGSAPRAEEGGQLTEITVTARRREETLQSVPLTVQAFGADAIENKGIRDMADVVKQTPGIFMDKGFVQQDVRPNIRGLPATRGRPPVGILLDGIDISSESIASAGGGNLANMKLVDLERIEVVKGPQSALYGRVAFGGAINYISKEPTSDRVEGYVSGEVATYSQAELRGAINLPATDTLSFRFNGAYSYFDGFYDNDVTGKRIGGYESKGGAVAAKFQPSSDVKLVARASYSDDTYEVRPQYYIGGAPEVNMREAIALPSDVAGQQVGIIGAPQTTIGSTAYVAQRGKIGKGIGRVMLSADPATGEDFPGTHVKTFLSSLRGEFAVSDNITVSTWTGFTRSRSRQRQDADFFGRPLTSYTQAGVTQLAEVPEGGIATGFFFFDAATLTKQFSQEVRIGDQTSSGFRWAVGGLYWWEDVKQKLGSISNAGFSAGGQPVNIYSNLALLGGYGPAQDQGRTTEHYSAYALAEYDLTDQLTVSAEGRYGKEKYDYLFARSIAISTTAVNGVYPFALTGSVFEASTSTNYFAPKVGLTYKVNPDLMFYGSFSRGIKPAGMSQVQTPNPDDAAFGTEKLNNYEIGFKSSLFNRRLRFNASIFRMDYKDKQESTLVPVDFSVNPQGNVSLVQNVGGARIDGAEVELAGVIAPGLTFSVGYTYLDARYTDYDLPSTSPITIALAGGCTIRTEGNLKGCFVNLDGKRLEASARHSAVGSLNYRAPLTGDLDLLLESDIQYRSRRYQDNTNSYWYAPYANVDLRAGVENDRYSVIFFVTNLFDNRSIQSAQSGGDTQALPSGGLSMAAFAADKRQFGLRGRFNF